MASSFSTRIECHTAFGCGSALGRALVPILRIPFSSAPESRSVLRNEANKSFVMNNNFHTPIQPKTGNWRIQDDRRHG